ncbi:MAG: methyltransferase domain-containing protein [Gomphosphaeria aponina SAG 52.96 = DSM 107014]|uniref:Methyltransferase domain-containing protein n=1 Tax=Gomphosphaeria aponina SAG 52.96 = DSM 107014 TaxID=1521640 RepID=A0A941GSS5_9CHRO|nr:methyltransferase domain-containing protein [Gomphosphaeria aponina SAG 52.96 = DSM 107014]
MQIKPKQFIKKNLGIEDQLWLRVVETKTTRKLIGELSPAGLNCLEISGNRWKDFGFKTYKSTAYPDYDVCEAPLTERYDVIIAEHVFEHLLWPYRAGKNVYEMLNEGGYLLISTPFLVRLHTAYADCSRWSETGLKYFLAECGFPLENTSTGSWGNRACIKANFLKWVKHRGVLHSMVNEPNFPIVVWALTKKHHAN